MELLKNLFSEGEALTYDQLTEKISAAGLKLANIADGSYVSRDKMDSKVKGLQGQISDLQGQVKQRDTDMAELQTKLTAAQTDADKLASVQSDLAALRQQRENDGKEWERKIAAQAYEFAIREKAGEVKFSSNAAKKQFIADAIAKQFKQDENGKMQGYDEFLTQYKTDDPGQEGPVYHGSRKARRRYAQTEFVRADGGSKCRSQLRARFRLIELHQPNP